MIKMIEQEILSTLEMILYRLDKIDEKLDRLDDPYGLGDYWNNISITSEGYEVSESSNTDYIKYTLMNKG